MTKIKVSAATPLQLDWLVAKTKGYIDDHNTWLYEATLQEVEAGSYHPTTNWSQGGPIIDRENIVFGFDDIAVIEKSHIARKPGFKTIHNEFYGPTKLIAAMRCYCASKLGDEVEVPEELK